MSSRLGSSLDVLELQLQLDRLFEVVQCKGRVAAALVTNGSAIEARLVLIYLERSKLQFLRIMYQLEHQHVNATTPTHRPDTKRY